MTKSFALAAAGLLALGLMSGQAHAAACASGATNGYSTKLADGSVQCAAAIVLSDGRILQLSSPVDATGAPISPAVASLQTTGNNTLASILSAQATAAKQDIGNTALASILSGMATASGQNTGNLALGAPADTAWSSGSGSLVALGKAAVGAALAGNSAQATAANQASQIAALGAPADTAYAGSGSASLVAALKGLYVQLGTIIGQAVPTSVVGTSLPAGTQTAGLQGVTGGVKVGVDSVVQATSTDVGGTITTGGTAQQLMAANTARRGWSVQNQSTGDEYVNCTTQATLDYHSLKIPAGALYESSTVHVGTGACSIIGATTGQAFYARQF